MYALVTGGNGFLGKYIVEQLLARGDKVRVFCRKNQDFCCLENIDVCLGDLRDVDDVNKATQNVDIVFHTAAMAGISCRKKMFWDINATGTLLLINACLNNHVKKFIYTSSPSVVFDGNNQNGINESTPYPAQWLAHYPETKAKAEQIVLASNGKQELLTCAIRPHLIWGPRDRHIFPRLIERAKQKKLKRIGDGTNIVDITYVENAATAHLQAADALTAGSRVAGNAYFISQGEPVNCWGFINRLLSLVQLPPIERSISFESAWRTGMFFEFFYNVLRLKAEPNLTRFLVLQLARSHWFDISRAQNDFGYKPLISTEEGLERLAREVKGNLS
ncbi:MAG: NAD-dependent epimerase/dehydratase family protein [Planctomycetaceae bacterium]|jgi:nucleoside-diphosphate-sugar epimerase|nr:NAD-dependent epimerase/dehydratase family protein [Planctomycetaceae bacterium]